MHMLTVWDKRLEGNPPTGNTVLHVNEDYSLYDFVSFAAGVAAKQSNQVYLRICAHGRGMNDQPSSQGGNGLVFCRGDLGWERLNHLLPLKGKFLGGVDLYSCGAAYINPGWGGHGSGDGNYFCFRMAQVLGTNVRASSAKQTYSSGRTRFGAAIDFGKWEGTVITYGPSGAVIKVEHGAAAAPFPDPLMG